MPNVGVLYLASRLLLKYQVEKQPVAALVVIVSPAVREIVKEVVEEGTQVPLLLVVAVVALLAPPAPVVYRAP